MSGDGYAPFVRNLSRSPGYGLRRRRKEYGPAAPIPEGPRLIPGRGRARRRDRQLGPGVILATLVFVVAGFVAVLWFFFS